MKVLCGILAVLCILFIVFIRFKGKRQSNIEEVKPEDGFADFHTHILPGVDHGASDFETALKMLEQEAEDGIGRVLLTPHYFPHRTDKAFMHQQFNELKRLKEDRKLNIELYLGNELCYGEDALEDLMEDKVCTLNDTPYVLTEFHRGDPFSYIRDGLNQILMAGYRPILAHVERYEALSDQKKVGELVSMGVLIQTNAGSLLKKEQKKHVLGLAKNDMIHLLGSDCHDLTKRVPGTRQARILLQKELTKEQYERIMITNPKKVLQGEYIH